MSAYDLRGKTAIVTGGARGIGLETCRALAARGARVVVVDLAEEAAARAAGQLGGEALGVGADVTDRAAVQRAVALAAERFGRVDVVVANAGIGSRASTAAAVAPEVFERVLEVNTQGVWRTVQAALPEVTRRGGHVVVIGSIYSFSNGAGAVPYAMSKAAVEALGRALRVELAQHGAGATIAYFGWIDTTLVRDMVDADPIGDRLLETLPAPLRKRLPARAAGEAVARAIERRAATVVRPRRWRALMVLRGVVNPLLDAHARRDPTIQAILRELDGRAGQEQPTSA